MTFAEKAQHCDNNPIYPRYYYQYWSIFLELEGLDVTVDEPKYSGFFLDYLRIYNEKT